MIQCFPDQLHLSYALLQNPLYRLGYKKVNYVAAFKEVEYELKCYTTDRTNAESNSTNPEKLVYSEPMMKILGVCQGWEHQKDFVQDITDEKE